MATSDAETEDKQQPKSTPRSQHGEGNPIGKGPSGTFQTDDQDNLHNNVSNLGEGDDQRRDGKRRPA